MRCKDIIKVAEFYVEAQTSKKQTLWENFNKSVIQKNTLNSTAGRNAWLSAWQANGAKRFQKVHKSQEVRFQEGRKKSIRFSIADPCRFTSGDHLPA